MGYYWAFRGQNSLFKSFSFPLKGWKLLCEPGPPTSPPLCWSRPALIYPTPPREAWVLSKKRTFDYYKCKKHRDDLIFHWGKIISRKTERTQLCFIHARTGGGEQPGTNATSLCMCVSEQASVEHPTKAESSLMKGEQEGAPTLDQRCTYDEHRGNEFL